MLGVTEQLSQLSVSPSPSKPSIHRQTSTAGGGVVVLNPYSPTPTPAQLANIDTSLSSAVGALVHHLTQPLSAHYPHSVILTLRSTLADILSELFEVSWRPLDPSSGTGYRSLICTRTLGLPKPLSVAAARVGIDESKWISALKGKARDDAPTEDKERDEWEAWCDPGLVCWRYGGWKYFDADFDPVRPLPESTLTIWKAGPTDSMSSTSDGISTLNTHNHTPARPSAAITIRAPSVSFIPATPAQGAGMTTVPAPLPIDRPISPALMPSANIGVGIAARPPHSRSSSTAYSARSPSPISEGEEYRSPTTHSHARAPTYPTRAGHRQSSGSTSSISSSISDSNSGHTQLLTPASRPGSADPFTTAANAAATASADDKTPTPGMHQTGRGRDPSPVSVGMRQVTPTAPGKPTPSVTPYDGGNVTVLGGGVKLGGGPGGPTASRPGSVIGQHRMPIDRSRSPSISLASRALNSAMTPGELVAQHTGSSTTGGGRKPRTRRRIMPTYLGYVGQPGVGGPVGNAFQPMVLKGLTPLGPVASAVPGGVPQQQQMHGYVQPGVHGQPGQIPMGQMGNMGGMGWPGAGLGMNMGQIRQPSTTRIA